MELLKEILSSKPVLKFFDPPQPVKLEVDASKLGQGAGILQDEHPIAYAPRVLIPAEENYSQIERELQLLSTVRIRKGKIWKPATATKENAAPISFMVTSPDGTGCPQISPHP